MLMFAEFFLKKKRTKKLILTQTKMLMKKRFIFLVMLFSLLGGVNWNVLNAQDNVVTIGGDATSYNVYYPIAFYANYQLK